MSSLFLLFRLEAVVLFALVASGQPLNKPDGRHLLQATTFGLYQDAYQDTTTQLQNSILDGDVAMATSLLTVSKDVHALAAGLRFPEGDTSQFNIMTTERTGDPDVVTIKAIASASLRVGDCGWVSSSADDQTVSNPQVLGILKLSKVLIIAITPESGVFPEDVNQFELQVNIINMLADRAFMQQIVDDNPLASLLNRKLLVDTGTPVRSWVCSFCYPRKFCRTSSWWCKN